MLPDSVGNSEDDEVQSVDSSESADEPDFWDGYRGDSDSDHSIRDLLDAAEADRRPRPLVLAPSSYSVACVGCVNTVTIHMLGTPDGLTVFDRLLTSERLSVVCTACVIDIENRQDERV